MLLIYEVTFSDNFVGEVIIPQAIIDQEAYVEALFGGTVVKLKFIGIK